MYTPSPAMAAFYLNLRDGEALIRDPEPYFFATAQQARDAAMRAMRRICVVDAIEIADETGHAIAVVHRYDAMPVRYH
jgi:hypothetical protein